MAFKTKSFFFEDFFFERFLESSSIWSNATAAIIIDATPQSAIKSGQLFDTAAKTTGKASKIEENLIAG